MYGESQEAILGNSNHKSFNFDPEPLPNYMGLSDDEMTSQVEVSDAEWDTFTEFGI